MADTGKPEREIAIEREDGPAKGRYVIRIDGHEAEMTYSKAGETRIIIDHTGVPDELRGLGLGPLLVKRGVEDARKEGKKIIPLCPFAKGYIDRHPELQDVVQ
ncbi:MAG: GNAT family N-acetyltransferase [Amphiplicatus sp.]